MRHSAVLATSLSFRAIYLVIERSTQAGPFLLVVLRYVDRTPVSIILLRLADYAAR